MNEKLKELINGIGMMTEVWMISYNGFKNQGMNDKDALIHTKEFMGSFMSMILTLSNTQGGDGND